MPATDKTHVGRLCMTSLGFDLKMAHRFAKRLGVPPEDCDLGYLAHLVLTETFGEEMAPRPFCVRGETEGRVDLYGYTRVDATALEKHAEQFAPPDAHQSVDWESLASKPMPRAWEPMAELGFELLACPMQRPESGPRRDDGGGARPREADVFLNAVRAAGPAVRVDRTKVYVEWLSGRLGRDGAADVVTASVVDRRFVKVLRRDHKKERTSHTVSMPAVTFRGVLRVRDGQAFDRLLGGGVGRQAGLGFGMLLLRPTRDAVAPAHVSAHAPAPRNSRLVPET